MKVIALWGPARSLSTTMVKSFEQRSDCAVEHEPFNDCYYFSTGRVTGMYGDQDDLLGYDGAAAQSRILGHDQELVFFKDMAYLALPYVADDFLRRCTNTFIVRDPRLTLHSRKKLRSAVGEFEFGFTALWTMWRRVVREFRQPAVVIDGEQLRAAPERVLRRYCDAVGIAFDQQMLRWQSGPLRNWQSHEADAQTRWHGTLERSAGFIATTTPPQEMQFDFTPAEWHMVDHAMVIYEEIQRHAL